MGDPLRESDFASAFEPLFNDAFDVAYRILGDVDEAEDVAVEALTRARLRWAKVGPLPYRDAWVVRAAANAAIARVGDPHPVSDSGDDNAALRGTIVAALAGLPRREREVLALRYVAGVDEGEVAACLGMSVDSVKKHVLHATTKVGDRVGRPDNAAESLVG